jgi:hypothetical protein
MSMSPISILLIAFATIVAFLLIVALSRAIATPRAAPAAAALSETALEEAAGIEDALAAVVRRPTVSFYDESSEDEAAFAAFKRDLEGLSPRSMRP